MVALLAGLLFSFGFVLALGTIIGMSHAYRDKALAALRMEHRPASPAVAVHICYSPARGPRLSGRTVSPSPTALRRHIRAA